MCVCVCVEGGGGGEGLNAVFRGVGRGATNGQAPRFCPGKNAMI